METETDIACWPFMGFPWLYREVQIAEICLGMHSAAMVIDLQRHTEIHIELDGCIHV